MQRLTGLQGGDPLILLLSRGMFCRKDHRQHLNLAQLWPELRVGYATGIAASVRGIGHQRRYSGRR